MIITILFYIADLSHTFGLKRKYRNFETKLDQVDNWNIDSNWSRGCSL